MLELHEVGLEVRVLYHLTRRGVQTSREVPPQSTSADPAEGSRTFNYSSAGATTWNLLHSLETVHILIPHPAVELDYLCNLCSVRLAHHAPIERSIHSK